MIVISTHISNNSKPSRHQVGPQIASPASPAVICDLHFAFVQKESPLHCITMRTVIICLVVLAAFTITTAQDKMSVLEASSSRKEEMQKVSSAEDYTPQGPIQVTIGYHTKRSTECGRRAELV